MHIIKNKLTRSPYNKWIGGVCGGLGEYFDNDPVIWRLIFLFGALSTIIFPFTLLYIIMWIVMPKER